MPLSFVVRRAVRTFGGQATAARPRPRRPAQRTFATSRGADSIGQCPVAGSKYPTVGRARTADRGPPDAASEAIVAIPGPPPSVRKIPGAARDWLCAALRADPAAAAAG
ncbi:hypothetical protein [Streptomyces sp. NPDC016845]|uniref:hypothetical protein n=1 Tax=Streptomyces sp. NPDC016845 TaxID=3364972 RepID=UPI0037B1FEDF